LRFKSKLDILVKNPFNNNLDIKVLKWLKNSFRLRIWKYRFIFTVENELIIFQWIWSRWDVYN
jgi:mRNA-degrading endonuclease RelE of RelBE toxin-antitoxin system